MNISCPSGSDIDRIKYLWKCCFGDSDTFIEYFFSRYYNPEKTIALYEDEKIVSYLMIFDHRIWASRKEIKAAYIAGVCTDPEYRNRGYITSLMSALDERLKTEKYDAAFLIPFKFSFYEKYGYKCMSYLTVYSGDVSSLKEYNCEIGNFQGKEKIYYDFCKDKNIFLSRNEKNEDDFLSDIRNDGGEQFLCEDAFMYYFIEKGVLTVQELVFSSLEGAKRALSFIKNNPFGAEKFKIRSDFSLSGLLSEKNIEISILPHTMAKFYNGYESENDINNYFNMIGWV